MLKMLVKWFFPLVFSIMSLYFLISKFDSHKIFNLLMKIDLRYFSLALLVTLTFPFLGALRWRTVVKAMGGNIKILPCIRVTFASFSLNVFLPSKAGDLVKAAFLREHGGFVALAGTVLLERLIDVCILAILSIFGSIYLKQKVILFCAVCILFIVIIGLFTLTRSHRFPIPQKVRVKVDDIALSTKMLAKKPVELTWVIIWSVLNWLGTMVETYLIFFALGYRVPFITILSILPIAIFVGLLPITISGIGTRDAALISLLVGIVPKPVSLSAGILYTVVSYWFLGIIGLFFLTKSLIDIK